VNNPTHSQPATPAPDGEFGPDTIDSLTADDTLPAALPPRPGGADQVMVPRSVRWPLDLDQRVKAAAAARGLTMSQLMREWAELELAALENDQPISRSDALRALAGLRPIGGAA
jgi:predicted DNA-binding protein